MIDFIDVSLRFKKGDAHIDVLQNVNVSFDRDATIGILGARGSGKSSVLDIMHNTLLPSAGHVVRHGTVSWPLATYRPIITGMTLRGSMRILAGLYGFDSAELIRRAAELGGLYGYLDEPAAKLSRDLRGRAAYSIALALAFDVYLIDETMFLGDESFRERSKIYLKRMLQRHAFIIASRMPSLLERHCDIVYVLHEGRLRRYDDPHQATKDFQSL